MDEQEMIRFLRSELYQAMERDPELRAALKRIDAGKGTFQDTAQYSERTSELLGQILSRHVDELPEGMREAVCKALLRERYEEVNGICAEVQEQLDAQNDIRLQPQRAPYPAERVQQVAHALEDPTVALSVIQRRAKAPVANVSKSFHDDYMRENARIRAKLGLKPLIIRYGSGCCSWCSAVAGRYRFGEAPDDVFRRHDNCDCTIIYDTQVLRGERTEGGGRSKKWVEVDPAEVEANGFEPTVNSQERAAEIEQTALSRLTLAGERDIIFARAERPNRKIGSQGQQIIDKPTYNKLTKDFLRRGGYIKSDEEAVEHLRLNKKYAAYLPSFNTILVSPEATVSDILEETYHAEQDRIHMFGEKLTDEVILKREIDAQHYLLSMTERYKIPESEVELTRANLEYYEEKLKKLLQG